MSEILHSSLFEILHDFDEAELLAQLNTTPAEWEEFKRWKQLGGQYRAISPVPVLEALRLYVGKSVHIRSSSSVWTRRQYSHVLDRFQRFVAQTCPDQMTHEIPVAMLEQFIKRWGRGRIRRDQSMSSSTHNQRLTVLRAFFDWCVDMKFVEANPLRNRDIRFQRIERLHTPAILSTQQAETVLQLTRETRYAGRNLVMLLLFMNTGGRLSEVIGLREPDVDLDNRRIHYLGKGSKSRFVPIEDDQTCELLASYMSQLPRLRRHLGVSADVEDYLFYSHEGKSKGQPIGPRAVQDMLERILRRLDLPRTPDYARISVHKLRHGYACFR